MHAPKKYFLSLNRFESRKNIELALEAYAKCADFFVERGVKLIIAGGLDQKSVDCMETFGRLKARASLEGLGDFLELMPNIGEKQKTDLLR